MDMPIYIGLSEARTELASMGIELSDRQIKRAADRDAGGKRKLPFFVDPITGTLKIEKGSLVAAYRKLQVDAEKNLQE
ncbi:hypothetical protein LB533_25670 [Mesorhizobium sp. BR1-1-13]|uniref:hypothetical protein n=1 Tax=Mesorhizobium sp. BR1-1-13 TaxID=2876656 RepID=UPI001CD08C31|nr:hypothetical protein [Mesorhizobium sp. BR1-1-13]MBZ9944487.1 hypothetical protein [Mesorhizobium sp. BR1-1-13]